MAGCFLAETFQGQERMRSFTVFRHNSCRICQKTLILFLHTVGYWQLKALKASSMESGLVPRVHGNKDMNRRKLKLTLKDIRDVVQFILNYAGVCMTKRGREGGRERGGERESTWMCACVCSRGRVLKLTNMYMCVKATVCKAHVHAFT